MSTFVPRRVGAPVEDETAHDAGTLYRIKAGTPPVVRHVFAVLAGSIAVAGEGRASLTLGRPTERVLLYPRAYGRLLGCLRAGRQGGSDALAERGIREVIAGPNARLWLAVSAVVAGLAVAVRIHSAFLYAPLYDFDGPGHALNVLAIHRGRLPDVATWAGFHPPLYYALGALVWALLPEAVPVHVGLRLLSGAAGLALAVIVWRTLARLVSAPDAAIAGVVVFCSPVFTIASDMLGNEMLCACFVTAALSRLVAVPWEVTDNLRHAVVTSLFLVGGLLTKSTALIAVPVCAGFYALGYRGRPARALVAAALVGGLPLLAASPHYARLLHASGGSLLSVVSGAALTPEVQREMRVQPPGERHLRDYLTLPPATFLSPVHVAPGMERSVPGMLWGSTWADAHGEFLPMDQPAAVGGAAALSTAGLLPVALAAFGLWRFLRSPRSFTGAVAPLVFAAALMVAFLRYTWMLPAYSAVKASYLLPASLSAALLLALGLDGLGPRARVAARIGCLALAFSSTLVLWQVWWT